MVDRETLLHVARVARIDIEGEVDVLLEEIERIKELVYSVEGGEVGEEEVLAGETREDKLEEGEEMLPVFPEREGRYLKVPPNI